jgi:hypothetical protein
MFPFILLEVWKDFFNETYKSFINPVFNFTTYYQNRYVADKIDQNVASDNMQLDIILNMLDIFEDQFFPPGKRSNLSEIDQSTLEEFDKLHDGVMTVLTANDMGSLRSKYKQLVRK